MSVQRDEQRPEFRQAEGRLQLAQERLAAEYPFFVALLARTRVTARPGVGTMAVVTAGEDLLLLHNPTWVLGIPVAELVGVLLHEVHHVLFGHLTMRAEDYPNRAALTIAQEVTVNEYIAEPLPGKPVLLKDYPILPPRESTAERYRRLEKVIPDDGQVVVTLDNHDVWAEAGPGDGRAEAEAAVRQAVEDALALVDPGQVPQDLRDALRALGVGSTPGGGREGVATGGRGRVDWQRLLRRYVGQVLEVRPLYGRPPRRFPELAGVLPGRGRQAARPKVMAVIDTSASITAGLLSTIEAELARLARHHEVLVVECDCRVQRVYPFRPLADVWGRGGTDFRPAFEPGFLRRHRPDLVVYFTDGYGEAPDRPPGVPVVWCLTPGGRKPARWGKDIHMHRA
jgi:predicted metal-dependent peptidase